MRQETIATEETKNAISVAYRLGGIETLAALEAVEDILAFPLSTAEAVLRRCPFHLVTADNGNFYCLPLRRY